jgi:hypothetical protein
MLEIPINKDGGAWRTLSVNLSGVSLSIRLLWNSRDGHWFADFESVDGKNNGIRLVTNTPLLAYKNRCLKGGDLVVLKKTLDCKDPLGFDNLGSDYTLNYIENVEKEYLLSVLKGEA